MSEKESSLVPLDRADIIELAGADAIAFAHAQFASDVETLDVGYWQWSAWLTAQGRTRCVFALLRIGPDRLLMWLPLGGARAIRDALSRFVLRAKVRIEPRENWTLCRLDEAPASAEPSRRIAERAGGYAFAQPGPAPRIAWLGPASSVPGDSAALNDWRLADIAAGLPWIGDETRDEFVPQALDLERLDAVRFDKGCYPGQEIAARLHFRGGAKQRLCRIVLHGNGDAPSGMRIASEAGDAGMILYSAAISPQERHAVAVLSDTPSGAALRSAQHDVVSLDKVFYIL